MADLATGTSLKIVHKLNSKIWFEYINRNFENIIKNTNFYTNPVNLFRSKSDPETKTSLVRKCPQESRK